MAVDCSASSDVRTIRFRHPYFSMGTLPSGRWHPTVFLDTDACPESVTCPESGSRVRARRRRYLGQRLQWSLRPLP